jgi:hypothetical protein
VLPPTRMCCESPLPVCPGETLAIAKSTVAAISVVVQQLQT